MTKYTSKIGIILQRVIKSFVKFWDVESRNYIQEKYPKSVVLGKRTEEKVIFRLLPSLLIAFYRLFVSQSQ